MTPGVLPVDSKLAIYRGTAGSWDLTFTDTDTGDPINLTGKTFTAQVRDRSGGPLLVDMTVTGTDLANGEITLSWTAADTANIPQRQSRWGLLDSDDILWIEDICHLRDKTPE